VYTPQPASQTPGPEGDLCSLHWGLNSRISLPAYWPTIGQVYILSPSGPPWDVWQKCVSDTTKKRIPTEDEFSYGTTKRPSDEVYQSLQKRRLSSFSMIHTIDGVKHALIENGPVFIALPLYNSSPTFCKSNNDQAHDFHAVSIEGYDSNGFFFRNSWGMDWGNNSCGYLPLIDWSRVVEACCSHLPPMSALCTQG